MSNQKQQIVHLKTGEVITKSAIGWRSTNHDRTEEYGTISYDGRTIAVRKIGRDLWEERQER